MYQCEFCTLQTKRKHNLEIHMLRKHKKHGNNITPTIVSGNNQSNGAPTTQYSIQPTSHYESTSAEIYPPNTVTMEEHNNVVEIANGWKNACENLQHSWKKECEKLNNRIKSGVFTREDIDF